MQQDKHKVTLHLSKDLHQQLKVRSVLASTTMSDMAEQAIAFFLEHPEVVEAMGAGHTHRVYHCPTCSQPVVLRNGELVGIGGAASVLPVLEDKDSQLIHC
ncbi:MAG: hypothetical protein CV045_11050 [Cyanobacteria bacterium M5B4]|nr:MAG: hypothetical protein CV045_11050 [Cyanobacteria bacterium M5B4]